MIPFFKKILFYFILIIFPILFLFIVEGLLRIVVPAKKPALVSEVSYDNIEWYQLNRDFLRQYFPSGTPLIPEFKPVIFKKEKNKRLFRVICLGGSSMFGTPYQMNANIPGILRKQLRHLYPEKEIEVLNFGASAINSQVVAGFVNELFPFKPDLVLIYMGHNEFYGPGGVGAGFLEKKFPVFYEFIKGIRIYTVLRDLLSSDGKKRAVDKNLMKQVSGGSLVHLDSEDSRRVFSRYEHNLTAIINDLKNAGIPVIVSDICSNNEFAPFVSDSLINGQKTERIVNEAKIKFENEGIQASIEYLQEINRRDSTNAEINFRLAKLYQATGEIEKAKSYYVKAADYDLLKFRAPSSINKIIRKVCKEARVPIVSTVEYLEKHSLTGLPGFDLFWEHLHPNVYGYYLIANTFLEKIIKMKLVSPKDTPTFEKLPFNADLLSIPWLDLAYGEYANRNLTGKWPFTNFRCQTPILNESDDVLKQIVEYVYARKFLFDEGCYKSAYYFESKGNYKNAETTYKGIIEEYPYNFYAHYQLAVFYKNRNRLKDAVTHYNLSLVSNPDYYYSYIELGMIQVNVQLFDEAIKNFIRAEKLLKNENKPGVLSNVYYGMAAALVNKGEFGKSLDMVDRALKLGPQYHDALQLKKFILEKLK